uniref:SH3 domain-containing protein n=1 Tax=Bionectria ochroleuca TaxID=29856 RepID=A0A8H7NKK6_BIOOC
MEANKSLRNIKNELENLLEKGVIDESVYDTIHSALPQESPLSGPLRTTSSNSVNTASSARATPQNNHTPLPPSYEDTPPPSLPVRNAKPVVAHARALYRYVGPDDRDLAFERDDKILVHEYMNDDWWMGQNKRTGLEGIFPRNYVLVEHEEKAPAPSSPPTDIPSRRVALPRSRTHTTPTCRPWLLPMGTMAMTRKRTRSRRSIRSTARSLARSWVTPLSSVLVPRLVERL